jgi:oxalate---CoA ligase
MHNFACIWDILSTHARNNPESLAILSPQRMPLTYAVLCQHIYEIARLLNESGIRRNDRIAVIFPTGPEAAVAFLTVSSCATCVPLNPVFSAHEFSAYFRKSGIKALIIQAGLETHAMQAAHELGLSIVEAVPGDTGGLFTLFPPISPDKAIDIEPEFAQGEDILTVIATSGTTSLPKLITLPQRLFITGCTLRQHAFQLTEQDRLLNVRPLFYSGPISNMVASLVAGASIICTTGFEPLEFSTWLDEHQPTWYSAPPALHQSLAIYTASQSKGHAIKSNLRFIHSSSTSLPGSLMREMERLFDVPVIQGYASTETGLIAINPLPPGTRKENSVGVTVGLEIKIVDQHGNAVRQGEVGEVLVQGETVRAGQGYDEEPNASDLTDGWYRVGDYGYLDSDGYLYVLGRVKETINRAGEKISPAEVEQVLLRHPAVQEATVFPVVDLRLGSDVGAVIVPRAGITLTVKEIQNFVAALLVSFKVPRYVVLAAEIPKSPNGKIQRLTLAERLGVKAAEHRQQVNFVPPATPLEDQLVALWAQVLGRDKGTIGIHDEFLDLGGDSLTATKLIAQIRKSIRVEISPLDLFDASTVAQQAALIARLYYAP